MLFLAPACREKTASDFEVWGLDVSRHQQNVNWEKVIESEKPYFVLIKATEGTLIVDPTYEQHRKELEKAGIPWGAYQFFGHRTSGKEQARNFIKTAKLQKGNFLPVLDIEPHRFMTDPKKIGPRGESLSATKSNAITEPIRSYTARRIFTKHTCTETFQGKQTTRTVDRRLPRSAPTLRLANLAAYRFAYGFPGITAQGRPERTSEAVNEELQKLILQ